MGELFESTATLTHVDSSTRKAPLRFEASDDLPAVVGDSVQVQQVLLNLVLNAMDAVDGVPAERRTVTVRAERRGAAEVEVAVSDLGHGIEPEGLGRLFEPFFTTKAGGLGIGLSISRSIIEAHGGKLWAENNDPAGATFRFTLPVAPASVPA